MNLVNHRGLSQGQIYRVFRCGDISVRKRNSLCGFVHSTHTPARAHTTHNRIPIASQRLPCLGRKKWVFRESLEVWKSLKQGRALQFIWPRLLPDYSQAEITRWLICLTLSIPRPLRAVRPSESESFYPAALCAVCFIQSLITWTVLTVHYPNSRCSLKKIKKKICLLCTISKHIKSSKERYLLEQNTPRTFCVLS